MSLQALRDALPPYAADLTANLDAIADDRSLSTEERWGCLLAAALAAGEPRTLRGVAQAAAEPLGERGVEAVKSAVAVTVMNDLYYGSIGPLRNPEYATQPSGLRMDALAHPAADHNAFELWCMAVSTLHRCAPCLDAQDEELRRRGVPPARMMAAMRIGAVTGAVARVLAAEAALAEPDEAPDHGAPDGDGSQAQPEEARPEDARPGAPSPPAAEAGTEGAPPAEAPPPTPSPAGTADPAVTAAPYPLADDLKITPG